MGIGQIFKDSSSSQKEDTALKDRFNALKQQEIPQGRSSFKVLNLTYRSSCGCGGFDYNSIQVIVPEDYNDYRDGDIVEYEEIKELRDRFEIVY